tara:strand:+ start:1129 stop:4431 length:3303 start_codon:yes stop_codon:yes gene_type:complete
MANGFDPRSQFYKAQASQVTQKRQALTYARQRQDAEERTKVQNVNTLSGFQASQIPEGPMRQIYEDRIRDAQSYMNGAGSYEGQEYSALEAANKISGLTTMFNKMSAHNMGDVAEAQAAYKKGAFEIAEDRERINPYGDPSGEAVYANNSPDGYRSRVQRHNNYFQWTGDYDANGDPLGYMIGDDGQPTGEPTSIFKMQGYANPSAFESDTVTEPIPALVDVVSDPKLQRRMSTIAALQSTQDILKEKNIANDAALSHQEIASMVIRDYMGTSKEDMEFRESIVREMQNRGFELKDHQIQAFINNPTSADPTALGDIQQHAAEILSDLTYNAPTVASSPFEGKFEVQGRGGSVADATYMVEVDRLREPVEISGGENLPGASNSYTINGVGFDQTNGDILIPITYTEEEDLDEEQRGLDIEARTFTTNRTLRIPAGELNQADPLALEAYRNLPPMEQARINSQIATSRVISDEDMASELSGATTTAQTPTPPTEPQPQQEETLDIEDIPLEEENLDESVDGRPLTPLAALPAQTSSLIDQANEVNERFPVRGASRTPEIAAATETLRDPSATDGARDRAESVLQQVISDGERMEELSRAEDIPDNAAVYRGSVYVPATENTQNPVSVPGREGNWEYVGDRTPTPDPGQQVYRPMTAAQREIGEAGMAGVSVPTFSQDVRRAESAVTEAIGNAARDLGLGALDDRADEIGRSVANSLFGPTEFNRQVGESVSDASSAASNLARDIRDNSGSNLKRAYDAARETLGGAGSAFLNFITGATSGIEEAGAEARPPAPRPSGSTFVPPSPVNTIATPETVANPSLAPESADVVAERERLQDVEGRLAEEQAAKRERLETIESEQMPEYLNELASLVPEMNLVSKFEGYASEAPSAIRANVPKGDDGKPHNNSGYTIGGLDISEHSLDDLPFLNTILMRDDFEKLKQLEGLKGQAAQDKLNELSEGGFDANLSYLKPNDIRFIEAETYRTKILPDLQTNLEENGASLKDFKNLPLSVRDAMNSVFFLSPASGSPKTTKLLAKAMNSGEKSDWEKLVKELDRFWDRSDKTQEERVRDEDDGISRGHVRRMQASAAQVAKQYDIPYTKS